LATLHVRNVPDPLYDALRERAARNGRSIGAEVVVLLERELDGGTLRRRLPATMRRRPSATPFERFSQRARQVVVDALELAQGLGAPGLGTEHLLLALFRDPPSIALMVIETAGLDEGSVQEAIAAEPAREAGPGGPDIVPFTPGAKKALELALREYIETGDLQIEPEHLLVGIAAESEGLGARILASAGQTAEDVRRAICMPHALPGFAQFRPQQGFRVLELTGDAGEWEREMNTFAARGYSLVEIVGGRAIFAVSMAGR
jgi:plasmid stability protein